ncbi:NAD(P)-binding domain-containing protein [Mycobacterium sp. 21AC1]|uniref:NADPH-dependent F420 reductase n=1 Tax=[Mycobacterium] appelbergii TaxID=2939269 RepID=UPI00293916C3|nr:NAD(P)-binding domain-containing protein [Mycobacterium sp. 21AC1]MDV3123435.1 NAD(P)-binding domain-containing protein [Mycobacterium sp. 21AC1]
MPQTIGIIGSGLVGGAVARLAVDAGYSVVLSNSRGPETIADLIRELGSLARAGTVEEAIVAADIVAIPVPLASFETLPAEKLAGKVVIDQTNYYPEFWRNTELDNGERTSSELVQRHLKDALVVKALHNLDWNHMYSNARPQGDPNRTTMPIAGDDPDAKAIVTEFLQTVGYDVIDAGSLAESWRIEPNSPIYFWPYAPSIPDGLTEDEQKRYYLEHPVPPISAHTARKMIDNAERLSPVGGTLAAMPPAHVAIFMDLASDNTVQK